MLLNNDNSSFRPIGSSSSAVENTALPVIADSVPSTLELAGLADAPPSSQKPAKKRRSKSHKQRAQKQATVPRQNHLQAQTPSASTIDAPDSSLVTSYPLFKQPGPDSLTFSQELASEGSPLNRLASTQQSDLDFGGAEPPSQSTPTKKGNYYLGLMADYNRRSGSFTSMTAQPAMKNPHYEVSAQGKINGRGVSKLASDSPEINKATGKRRRNKSKATSRSLPQPQSKPSGRSSYRSPKSHSQSFKKKRRRSETSNGNGSRRSSHSKSRSSSTSRRRHSSPSVDNSDSGRSYDSEDDAGSSDSSSHSTDDDDDDDDDAARSEWSVGRSRKRRKVKSETHYGDESVVTFWLKSSGLQFERILDSSLSLESARQQVRAKFSIPPQTPFRLMCQSATDIQIMLDDEDDLRAFKLRAQRSRADSNVISVHLDAQGDKSHPDVHQASHPLQSAAAATTYHPDLSSARSTERISETDQMSREARQGESLATSPSRTDGRQMPSSGTTGTLATGISSANISTDSSSSSGPVNGRSTQLQSGLSAASPPEEAEEVYVAPSVLAHRRQEAARKAIEAAEERQPRPSTSLASKNTNIVSPKQSQSTTSKTNGITPSQAVADVASQLSKSKKAIHSAHRVPATETDWVLAQQAKGHPCGICGEKPWHASYFCPILVQGGLNFAERRTQELVDIKQRKKEHERIALKDLKYWVSVMKGGGTPGEVTLPSGEVTVGNIDQPVIADSSSAHPATAPQEQNPASSTPAQEGGRRTKQRVARQQQSTTGPRDKNNDKHPANSQADTAANGAITQDEQSRQASNSVAQANDGKHSEPNETPKRGRGRPAKAAVVETTPGVVAGKRRGRKAAASDGTDRATATEEAGEDASTSASNDSRPQSSGNADAVAQSASNGEADSSPTAKQMQTSQNTGGEQEIAESGILEHRANPAMSANTPKGKQATAKSSGRKSKAVEGDQSQETPVKTGAKGKNKSVPEKGESNDNNATPEDPPTGSARRGRPRKAALVQSGADTSSQSNDAQASGHAKETADPSRKESQQSTAEKSQNNPVTQTSGNEVHQQKASDKEPNEPSAPEAYGNNVEGSPQKGSDEPAGDVSETEPRKGRSARKQATENKEGNEAGSEVDDAMKALKVRWEKIRKDCDAAQKKVAEFMGRQAGGEVFAGPVQGAFTRGKNTLIRHAGELEEVELELSDFCKARGVDRPPIAPELEPAKALRTTLLNQQQDKASKGTPRKSSSTVNAKEKSLSQSHDQSSQPEGQQASSSSAATTSSTPRRGTLDKGAAIPSSAPETGPQSQSGSRNGKRGPKAKQADSNADPQDADGDAHMTDAPPERDFDASQTPGLRTSRNSSSEADVESSPLLQKTADSTVVVQGQDGHRGANERSENIPSQPLPPAANRRQSNAGADDQTSKAAAKSLTTEEPSTKVDESRGDVADNDGADSDGGSDTSADSDDDADDESSSSSDDDSDDDDDARRNNADETQGSISVSQKGADAVKHVSGVVDVDEEEDEIVTSQEADAGTAKSRSNNEQVNGEDEDDAGSSSSVSTSSGSSTSSRSSRTQSASPIRESDGGASDIDASRTLLVAEAPDPISSFSVDADKNSQAPTTSTPMRPSNEKSNTTGGGDGKAAGGFFSPFNFFQSARHGGNPFSSTSSSSSQQPASQPQSQDSPSRLASSASSKGASSASQMNGTKRSRLGMPRLSELDASMLRRRTHSANGATGSGASTPNSVNGGNGSGMQSPALGASGVPNGFNFSAGQPENEEEEPDQANESGSSESESDSSDSDSDDEDRPAKKANQSKAGSTKGSLSSQGVLPASKRAGGGGSSGSAGEGVNGSKKKRKARGLAALF